MKTLMEHLSVATEKRDLNWIMSALQAGIELEHSTLPLYLSSMFSHETQNYTSYNIFRSVAMEEMVHMAIDCNILSAMGGTPQLKNLNPAFPRMGLPGNAEPDLEAVVAPLSKKQLQNFLRLESPEFLLDPKYKSEGYPTIGRLYQAIKTAVKDNADAVTAAIKQGGTSNQVGDDIGFTTIVYNADDNPLTQIYDAIDEIVEQGEGSRIHSFYAGKKSQQESSHYCRFASLYYGHEYSEPAHRVDINPKTVHEYFKGMVVDFPSVVNTLLVPSDGYAAILKNDPAGAAVAPHLLAFDTAYTKIMTDLEAMWNGPMNAEWPTFGDAVGTMAQMRVLSCFYIMPNQIPPAVISNLKALYPDDYERMAAYTNLDKPVFYGPRFFNLNVQQTGS